MSIAYELAKELKDARFPQNADTYWVQHDGEDGMEFVIHPKWDSRTIESYEEAYPLSKIVAAPTLSELIEACGDDTEIHINGLNGKWRAEKAGHSNFGPEGFIPNDGPTPEEAVAKLWLALNKKA